MIWRGSSNNHTTYGKGMCCRQIYCLWFSNLAPKRRNWIHCSTCQAMCNTEVPVCIVFSSDIRQARTLFCPPVSHTDSLMGKFQLIGAWICLSLSKVFHQSCEAWVKSDCHSSKLGSHYYALLLCQYSVGKFSSAQICTHIQKHTVRNTHKTKFSCVHYPASVSIWHTADVNVCTSA